MNIDVHCEWRVTKMKGEKMIENTKIQKYHKIFADCSIYKITTQNLHKNYTNTTENLHKTYTS